MKFSNSCSPLRAIFCVMAVLVYSAPSAAAAAALTLDPCELTAPAGAQPVKARCGRLAVAENPAQPQGRQISLRVAVVPAQAAEPRPDPLFLFAGGPGQAATEVYPLVAAAFREINQQRDIVLIDQRGTGGSNRLNCPLDLEDLTQAFDLEQVRRDTRECLKQLDGDPRFYTTTIAMQDYEQVRQALGYGPINLWGGSYGTRAAQVYLRQFPDQVRSMVLDSVAPPRLALGAEHASQLDRVLHALIERCQQQQACRRAFPDLAADYRRLRTMLTEQPRTLTVADPNTGQPREVLADRNSLALTLRFMAYSAPSQALVPLMIHRAAAGEVEPLLAAGLVSVAGLVDQLARGMELSVSCAEDEPYLGDVSGEADTLIGLTMVQALRAACAEWPRGTVPADFHQPITSAVPTLLLAGEMDPVTPPAYALEAAQQFSHHQVVVAPGQGHLVTPRGCLPQVVTAFIRSADARELATDCVQDMGPEPFFLSPTGPRP